ncbi:MAG TPA: O-methyltransferase [Actinocrinis sp.]
MNQQLWDSVDEYFESALIPADPVLAGAAERARAAGLPHIAVSPGQGRLLQLLARIRGARRILEVGTLGGYSAIWMARALPADGSLISLEVEPKHAEVARANLAEAGLADRVEVRLGPAAESLAALVAEQSEPFDFVFIDADKPSNPVYLEFALHLTRPGSVIVIDNVVRQGAVAEPGSQDASVRGVQRAVEMIAAEPRLSATAQQTVGEKGYDGFILAVVGD